MKRLLMAGAFILLTLCLFIATTGAAAESWRVVRKVRLLTAPGLGQRIKTLHPPERVTRTGGKNGDCIRVRDQAGNVGWVYEPYLAQIDQADAGEDGGESGPPIELPPISGAGVPNDASGFPIPGCGPEGKATSPERIKTLNLLKNRLVGPSQARQLTLEQILEQPAINDENGDEDRWSNSDGAELVGYVTKVKAMGAESCNCDSADPEWRDVHIELTRGPDDDGLPMVVEVTPQWAHLMGSHGRNWSATPLRQSILNRYVRFRGWMFYDKQHSHNASNTNPDGEQLHRQTAWELHPVTRIEVVPVQ